jgi:hypothetical protein
MNSMHRCCERRSKADSFSISFSSFSQLKSLREPTSESSEYVLFVLYQSRCIAAAHAVRVVARASKKNESKLKIHLFCSEVN